MIIYRQWSVCVVVVVLVAASLLAIITLNIQVKILQWIKENFKNHLVDWRRGKVDGREVAVLGQRICCCYLRLKKGYEIIERCISTAQNGRANLKKSESYLIELCILGLEGRRWGVHIRPIWHDDPLKKSFFKTKHIQTGFRTCSRSKLGSCSMALMLAGRPLVAAGAC